VKIGSKKEKGFYSARQHPVTWEGGRETNILKGRRERRVRGKCKNFSGKKSKEKKGKRTEEKRDPKGGSAKEKLHEE